MRLFSIFKVFIRRESGVTLLETVVALAILGTIGVIFLNGLTTTSKAAFIVDEQATAESLARSQMEWAQNADFVYSATQYSPASIPSSKDYINYSATITAEPLHNPDDGIQKITVTVKRFGETVIRLQSYKVDR
jgi:type II secretory pathway pseudopilin PulG